MTDLRKGLIDMHVHSAPDTRVRAYDDFQLMEAAIAVGARGIVIKSHNGSTAERAFLCNRQNAAIHGDNDFEMFGSITLNRQAGGLNPAAVEVAVEVVPGGQVVPELQDIFAIVKEADVVLGTGHISPEESFVVAEAARRAGVRKLVVTHPEWWLVGMSLEDQRRIVEEYGVLLERCYRQPMGGGVYQSNLESNLACVQAIGYEHVLISTDSGQVENVHWELGIQDYVNYLLDHGVPEEQVYYMTHTQQRKLLNLPLE